MARVAAFVPDLLFGSNVVGMLRAAGHDVVLCADADQVRREAPGADVLIVDLTLDAAERLEAMRAVDGDVGRTLAFYAHVEPAVRDAAIAAGADRAVPRSRMARDAAALVAGLLDAG